MGRREKIWGVFFLLVSSALAQEAHFRGDLRVGKSIFFKKINNKNTSTTDLAYVPHRCHPPEVSRGAEVRGALEARRAAPRRRGGRWGVCVGGRCESAAAAGRLRRPRRSLRTSGFPRRRPSAGFPATAAHRGQPRAARSPGFSHANRRPLAGRWRTAGSGRPPPAVAAMMPALAAQRRGCRGLYRLYLRCQAAPLPRACHGESPQGPARRDPPGRDR